MADFGWFIVAVICFPLLVYLASVLEERARAAAWRAAAARTGFEPSGAGGERVLRGSWQGIAVEIHQHVISRYKEAPVFEVMARARLPVPAPEDAGSESAPELAGWFVTEDGWLEHFREGPLDLDGLEALLDALVRAARHAASKRAQSPAPG